MFIPRYYFLCISVLILPKVKKLRVANPSQKRVNVNRKHMLLAYFHIVYDQIKLWIHIWSGILVLSRLKQAPVTIFGGSHLSEQSTFREQAQVLAQSLTDSDIPVLMGGASTYLAKQCFKSHRHTLESIMIITIASDKNQAYTCIHSDLTISYFASRKWLLISYSAGFIIFPGGFGTLSELTQLLTLIQTNMRKKAPIVLIGTVYWQPFMKWLKERALRDNLVNQEHLELFIVTDSLENALEAIKHNYVPDSFFW
jgi:uncharacterized protein (TIGR00730 family)